MKVLIERKTFLIRLEGDQGGEWCSMTEISRGFVFALGFEKEAVGWLVEYLTKALALKSHMGFNKKFRGKCRAHLLEVGFNNHGRFIRISEFATNRKPSVLIIPEGDKGRGWESIKKALDTMLVVPYPYAEEKGRNLRGESWPHYKVGSMHRSYAKTVSDEGPRGSGLVPVGRWARAVVCESKFDSEEDPKTDDLGAESQANRGLNASPLFSPCLSRPRKENLGERDSSPRKEADLSIFSSNEDMEGFLGRVGSDSRGSAAMVKPSSPETRGKGPSLMGNCVSRVAEILEVTPSLFNSIHPYIPPSSGFTNSLLNPPVHILSPSTPMSPDSSSQSLAPMENQVNSEFFSKKVNDEGQIPVDIPNLEMETEVIQPACPYQMSESVNSLSANLRSPCKESSKDTVHLGGIAGSPSGEFQIEGLSPRKMAKVREVLKTLDIKVYSRRKSRCSTGL